MLPLNDENGLIDSDAVEQINARMDLVPPEVSEMVLELVDSLPEDYQLPVSEQTHQTEDAQAGTRSQAETGSQTGKESTGEQKLNRNEKQVEAP